MLILKLGGAAITQKTTPNTPNRTALAQIAALLAKHPQPMVIVHGAGSFGHIVAEEHQLHLGYKESSQRLALVRIQQDLHTLNNLVVEHLAIAGLPAMTIHPASMCMMKQGRIRTFFSDPLVALLKLGLMPVLYGDCVWDTINTFGILSGDQLVVHLANLLGAERVAFGTNVDGVLDPDGKVIPQLHAHDPISGQANHPKHSDVTGGMRGKLDEIAQLRSARATIFNLQNLDQLEAILVGREQVGTQIIP